MTRPITSPLLLAGILLLTPALVLAQSVSVEGGGGEAYHGSMNHPFEDMAAGTALFVIALAVIALIFGMYREKRRQDLLARFIDKGQEIPSALLPQPPSRLRELRRGVWLTSLGLGVGLVLYIATGSLRAAAWCLILLFLGAASFLNAMLFYPNSDSRQ